MYLCLPAMAVFTSFFNSFLNSGGGSMPGVPMERSKTLSSPWCFLRSVPSSNILRIHDPSAMRFLTLSDTGMGHLLPAFIEGNHVYFQYFRRQLLGNAILPNFDVDGNKKR